MLDSYLTRIAHAKFLSDKTHCPMVMSKPVGRTTVSDSEPGPQPDELQAATSDSTCLLVGRNVQSNLLQLFRDRGSRGWGVGGDWYLCPITYSLHCHHQNDSALRRAAV